jgi:hypothetical protein
MNTLDADSPVSAERALNTAIVSPDITRGFEEYMAILERYYAENVEVSSDRSPELLVGKERVRSANLHFLVPLHVMGEIGGLSANAASISGDAVDDQYSEWSVELVGVTGRSVRTAWARAEHGNSRVSSLSINTRTAKTGSRCL